MNSQPAEIVGQIGAFIFAILVIRYFIDGWRNPHKYPNAWDVGDMFKLGEVYDEERPFYKLSPTNIMRDIDRGKKRSKPAKEKPPKPKNHALFDDGVDLLYSLGYKKTDARKFLPSFLDEHDPQTLQEFIKVFYATRKK
jgi:hypothetical protein|tara:strand:- start:398 stop:814 length:417 start_codon:yes stop_codon:yes gene_type:complete